MLMSCLFVTSKKALQRKLCVLIRNLGVDDYRKTSLDVLSMFKRRVSKSYFFETLSSSDGAASSMCFARRLIR